MVTAVELKMDAPTSFLEMNESDLAKRALMLKNRDTRHAPTTERRTGPRIHHPFENRRQWHCDLLVEDRCLFALMPFLCYS